MSGLPLQIRFAISAFACVLACALPAVAMGDATTGGAGPSDPEFQPHGTATLLPDGTAVAPPDAPPVVQAIIAAGNKIATLPYIYGGGHNAHFSGRGYDCSGSVSYVLHAGGLLSSPEDSSALEGYGAPGPGSHVTIYANAGHAWMTIDGRRFDTGGGGGSRWKSAARSSAGFVVRHPVGY
jgi:cell wall-associated NlpC family hydrolase